MCDDYVIMKQEQQEQQQLVFTDNLSGGHQLTVMLPEGGVALLQAFVNRCE